MIEVDLKYPSHSHPHSFKDLSEYEARIWVCGECGHIFTEGEIRSDNSQWGHKCKSHPCRKNQVCESHLEPYNPLKLK